MTLAILLLAATTPAAPVPEPKLTAAKAAAWDKLWAQAGLWNEPLQAELVCRLLKEPKPAAEYLRGKLPPIKLSKLEAKDLLARLASDKEEEWKAAYGVLMARDIRLAMTVEDAWAETTTEEQRRRLTIAVTYWGTRGDAPTQWGLDRIPAYGDYTLVPPPRPGGDWHLEWSGSVPPSRTRVANDLAGWQNQDSHAFQAPRVRLMLRTLEAMGTAEARAVAERMATGHPDVELTKEAAATARRMKGARPAAESRLAAGLRMLRFWQTPRGDRLNPADLAAFVSHPDLAAAFLKANLRPVKLTRKEGEALLTRLFGDDPAEVRAAFRELQKTDIRAALTMEDAWALTSSPDHRCRLVLACTAAWEKRISDDFDPDSYYGLTDFEYVLRPALGRDRPVDGWFALGVQRPGTTQRSPWVGAGIRLGNTLKDGFRNGRWEREAVGLHVLDVIGTDAAVAVITDVATGHEDAYPTTVAKWVLKRRGK